MHGREWINRREWIKEWKLNNNTRKGANQPEQKNCLKEEGGGSTEKGRRRGGV